VSGVNTIRYVREIKTIEGLRNLRIEELNISELFGDK